MRSLLLLIVFVLCVVPAAAQNETPDGCTADDWLALLHTGSAAIGVPGADLDAVLGLLASEIQAQRAMCNGLVFTGDTGGVVVGPFTLH